MAADSWSSADSRAFSPLCTTSVATCRIRSAVAGDACISFIQAPADQVYPVMPDGQPVGKFHPINYISELVALNRTLQSITPGLCQNHSRWFVQHIPHLGGEIEQIDFVVSLKT